MEPLPEQATFIDPLLHGVGADLPHQLLVFGEVRPATLQALLVAQLVSAHPAGDGAVGHYYGVVLKGITLGETFRPWAAKSIGEVLWCPERMAWVQVDGSVA